MFGYERTQSIERKDSNPPNTPKDDAIERVWVFAEVENGEGRREFGGEDQYEDEYWDDNGDAEVDVRYEFWCYHLRSL